MAEDGGRAAETTATAAPPAHAATHAPAKADRLRVFISYSRRDLAFADQLVTFLEWQGFQPVIDRKGIHGAEKWESRLGQLILESNIVVFVLSPDSAASEVCAWEVDQALARAKPIIPVLCRPLDGVKPHEALRDLNYIHFYEEKAVPGSGFGAGMVRLVEALSVDVGWLREHTRLEELAARWDTSQRVVDLLVRGSELASYKAWRDRRPANAPELTALQRAFLGASEAEDIAQASAERRRNEEMAATNEKAAKALSDAQAALEREAEAQAARARARQVIQWGSALLTVAVLAASLAFGAWQQRNLAEQVRLTMTAQSEAARATKSEAASAEITRQAQVTESGLLANAAALLTHDDLSADSGTAALLALEGVPDKTAAATRDRDRSWASEAEVQLDRSLRNLLERSVMAGHRDRVISAAFSPDGARVVTASNDRTARVWDVGTGRETARLEGHRETVRSAAFSPDGRKLVTASLDSTARLWDATTGREIARLIGHGKSVLSATFAPDGSKVVSASSDSTARVWDAATGKEIARLQGHLDTVWSAAFSPDGARVVTASSDGTARVWDVAAGKETARLDGHGGEVNGAAFSPDGARVVTASNDRTARVWDVAAGKETARLDGHGGQVLGAAFSPDGRYVITVGANTLGDTARIWLVAPTIQHLVDVAKDRLKRCLTSAQRRAYVLPETPPLWCVERRLWPYHGDDWQAWLAARQSDPNAPLPKAAP